MSSASGSRRLERLWYGNSPLAFLLLPLAWVYHVMIALRRRFYENGWLRSYRVGVPVIVVGNITAGGTGKTPIVEWLVQRLRAEGFHPAIASRGYGGRRQEVPVRVTAESRAAEVGDEPVLLSRRTGAPVAVCARRVSAASMLVAAGADVIVADDGLQHYALARDLEIIVMDGARRLGNGKLLPAGPLREPPQRFIRAGLVLVNGGPTGQGELGFTVRTGEALALNGSERRALESFAGKKVWVVAGIGNPERFLGELGRRGMQPVALDVADHGRVDLGRIRQQAGWPILMTEKDAVKYPDERYPDVWCVPAEVQMQPEVEVAVMSRVREAIGVARAAASANGVLRAAS